MDSKLLRGFGARCALATIVVFFSSIAAAAEGDLDPRIGTDGVAILAPTPRSDLRAIGLRLTSDGFVIVGKAGDAMNIAADGVLIRRAADGSADAAFAGDGTRQIPSSTGDDWLDAVAVQIDGKLVAVGASYGRINHSSLIIRRLPDGSRDPSFGVDGALTPPILQTYEEATAVDVAADGKVVFAGDAFDNSGASHPYVGRATAAGQLDTSFAGSGRMLPAISFSLSRTITVRAFADGSVLVVATGTVSADAVAVRLHANGTIDTSYGSAGFASTALLGAGATAAISADGSCTFVGKAVANGNLTAVRVAAGGALDAGFGSGGVATVAGTVTVGACAVDAAGGLAVTGITGSGSSWRIYVIRFDAHGALEATFGSGGISQAMS